MKLETKYNIGDRIWVVYEPILNNQFHHNEPAGEISVYEDTINSIEIYDDGILYFLEVADIIEGLKEEDIILYDDTDKLINKIKELMNEINEREGR